jgi:hypothetical protein
LLPHDPANDLVRVLDLIGRKRVSHAAERSARTPHVDFYPGIAVPDEEPRVPRHQKGEVAGQPSESTQLEPSIIARLFKNRGKALTTLEALLAGRDQRQF